MVVLDVFLEFWFLSFILVSKVFRVISTVLGVV